MADKYELTDITTNLFGKILYRIQALKDFNDVKKGDLGGYVHGYHNLSQDGNCWVYDEASILDDAVVRDNAVVSNNAIVRGNAVVRDNARVFGNARFFGNVVVRDNARVFGNAKIEGNVVVCKNANISSHAYLRGNIVIEDSDDFTVFKNTWSSRRYFTYIFPCKIWVVGCFYGTSEELIDKAYKDSKLSGDMYSLYVELVKKMEKVRNEQEV